jgi:hypothetical protein
MWSKEKFSVILYVLYGVKNETVKDYEKYHEP